MILDIFVSAKTFFDSKIVGMLMMNLRTRAHIL